MVGRDVAILGFYNEESFCGGGCRRIVDPLELNPRGVRGDRPACPAIHPRWGYLSGQPGPAVAGCDDADAVELFFAAGRCFACALCGIPRLRRVPGDIILT